MKRHEKLLFESKDRDGLLREAKQITNTMRVVKNCDMELDSKVKFMFHEARVLIENGYKAPLVENSMGQVVLSLIKLFSSSTSNEEKQNNREILELAGDAAINNVIALLAKNIAEMLGASDKWADFIAIAMSKMNISDIPRLITDCEFTTEVLFDIAIQYGINEVGDLIDGDSESGFFKDLIVSIFSEITSDSEIARTIKSKLSDIVCSRYDDFVDEIKDTLIQQP